MNQNKVTFVALSNRGKDKYFPQECFEEHTSYEKAFALIIQCMKRSAC